MLGPHAGKPLMRVQPLPDNGDDRRNYGTRTGRDHLGRFGPGNPGRPKGARHKVTVAAQALLDGEAEALTRKAVEMALSGDAAALRLVLERVVPPRKDSPVAFTLPPVTSAADAAAAMASIINAVANGELTPGEASTVAALVEQYRRTLETADIEARISALENAHAGHR
jgi:hypothetical protein